MTKCLLLIDDDDDIREIAQLSIEVGTETIPVLAEEAEGAERDRLFETQKQNAPQFAEYEQSAQGRVIPVMVLTPSGD